jgi:hypothetical protein
LVFRSWFKQDGGQNGTNHLKTGYKNQTTIRKLNGFRFKTLAFEIWSVLFGIQAIMVIREPDANSSGNPMVPAF